MRDLERWCDKQFCETEASQVKTTALFRTTNKKTRLSWSLQNIKTLRQFCEKNRRKNSRDCEENIHVKTKKKRDCKPINLFCRTICHPYKCTK